MSEFIPPTQNSVETWVKNFFPKEKKIILEHLKLNYQLQEFMPLPESVWEAWEDFILEKLEIKPFQEWVQTYPEYEWENILIYFKRDFCPSDRISKKTWKEIEKIYEKTTCR